MSRHATVDVAVLTLTLALVLATCGPATHDEWEGERHAAATEQAAAQQGCATRPAPIYRPLATPSPRLGGDA